MNAHAPVRHLPARLQWLAVIAVVSVFGGGAAVVWKWSHLEFRYRFRLAPSADSAVGFGKGVLVEVPREAPKDWIPVDLGIIAFSIPGPLQECEMTAEGGLSIRTGSCAIAFSSIVAGRELMNARDRNLRQLLPDGTYAPISFVEYATRAALAGTEDFRWSSTSRELWQLQEHLMFKALLPGQRARAALVFRSYFAKGVIQYVDAAHPRAATLTIAPYDDRELVVFRVEPTDETSDDMVCQLAASVRFPQVAFGDSRQALEARVQRQVAALRNLGTRLE